MEGAASKALRCNVCEEDYGRGCRTPVALPACGHTFCRQCLIRIRDSSSVLRCPNCRTVHLGPDPEDLPPNITLLSLLDVIEEGQGEARAQDQPTCNAYTPQRSSYQVVATSGPDQRKSSGRNPVKRAAAIGAAAVVGGVGLVVAAPAALTVAGFTTAGITGGSLAASMMSSAAIANGGSVAAGSLVAVLQSAGAAGIGATASAFIGSAGAAVGAGLMALFTNGDRKNSKRKCKKEEEEEEEDGKDSDSDDGVKVSSDDNKECDSGSNKVEDDGGKEFIARGTRI